MNTNNNKNNGIIKNKLVLVILSYLLGVFGIDRMYLGCWGTGLIKLFTIGGLGIWYMIDLVLIIANCLSSSNSPVLCGGYRWDKTSIEHAVIASKIILVLFVIKFILGFIRSNMIPVKQNEK